MTPLCRALPARSSGSPALPGFPEAPGARLFPFQIPAKWSNGYTYCGKCFSPRRQRRRAAASSIQHTVFFALLPAQPRTFRESVQIPPRPTRRHVNRHETSPDTLCCLKRHFPCGPGLHPGHAGIFPPPKQPHGARTRSLRRGRGHGTSRGGSVGGGLGQPAPISPGHRRRDQRVAQRGARRGPQARRDGRSL